MLAAVPSLRPVGVQDDVSPSLRAAPPRTSPLRKLCDTVAANPAGAYSLARLAALANVSPRHLTRLFRDELNTTPARYVELIRFDTARDLLDAGHAMTETALRSGYGRCGDPPAGVRPPSRRLAACLPAAVPQAIRA